MTRVAAFVFAAVAVAASARAQSPVAGAGRDSNRVRAAGMPLRDGGLAPGTLTVRVVNGGFSSNLPNQTVIVDVVGGASERAETGTDGRASFGHMPVGARVLAWTVVAGERIESEMFEMPAESGVRVLLIAGEPSDDATAANPGPAAAVASRPATTASTPLMPVGHTVEPSRSDEAPNDDGLRAIRLTWIALSAAAVLYLGQRMVRQSVGR